MGNGLRKSLEIEGIAVIGMCMLESLEAISFLREKLIPRKPTDYMDDIQFEYNFRFLKEHVRKILVLQRIPDVVLLRDLSEKYVAMNPEL